ncbi:hypothetical protein ACJMK2_041217 [Sinanodonta woodiana]|uniref:Uncharacterized protein n=1 Tax=Sinanodonta woodiana TaxID=1069815 RepID=A0ABD3W3I6_SINWO
MDFTYMVSLISSDNITEKDIRTFKQQRKVGTVTRLQVTGCDNLCIQIKMHGVKWLRFVIWLSQERISNIRFR